MPVSKIPGAGISGGSVTVNQSAPDNSLVIDSSGNVGIGTSSVFDSNTRLELSKSGNCQQFISSTDASGVRMYLSASGSTIANFGTFSNHALAFRTNDSERMRITAAGNVGIASTTANTPLQVWGTTNSGYATSNAITSGGSAISNSASLWNGSSLRLTANFGGAVNYTGRASELVFGADNGNFGSGGGFGQGNLGAITAISEVGNATTLASSMIFYTTAGNNISERMRINSSGLLNINTTSNPLPGNGPARINMIVPSGDDGINIRHDHVGNCINIWRTAGNGNAITFYQSSIPTQGPSVGGINTTSSSTSYNTSSDYRLKENIVPMTGALDKVAQLKPVTYTWKVDGSDGQGFIAHELQAVVPDCVTGEKDEVDEDGKPKYQGVDTSFLVATLTAAIQELKAELDATKAEVQALKGAN